MSPCLAAYKKLSISSSLLSTEMLLRLTVGSRSSGEGVLKGVPSVRYCVSEGAWSVNLDIMTSLLITYQVV